MSAGPRVVVTGIGLVTPLGVGRAATWSRLLRSESGLMCTKQFEDYELMGWNKIPSKVVGKVPNKSFSKTLTGLWDESDHFDRSDLKKYSLFSQYALVAAREALRDADLDPRTNPEAVGTAIGSGIVAVEDVYQASVDFNNKGYKKISPFFVPRILSNMPAGNVSIECGTKGPLHAVSTACATGNNAIGDAFNFIKMGYAKAMVAGGTEAAIHPVPLGGFARAKSVVTGHEDDPSKASRPFDGDRNGFVLGEGSGVLILEDLDSALARGVKPENIYGEILSYGLTGDSWHITAPREDGDGAYRAMTMALARSGLTPNDIDYVNAHATSTLIGDRAENNAMCSLFQRESRAEPLTVSSTKGAIGHLLGAAGAVEAAFTALAIKNQIAPPTLNLENPGKHIEDDETKFTSMDYVPNKAKEMKIEYALNNSFGFGGINSSVCFKRFQI